MIYGLIFGPIAALIIGLIAGYFVGRYQTQLMDKIRTLEGQAREEAKPEPTKPTVIAGAYQPPKEVSTVPDKKHNAGLVETKTPELLEWENKNELAKLEHGS